MSLWIERERYAGKTAEILDRLILECSAEEDAAQTSGNWDERHPGTRILIAAMARLSVDHSIRWGQQSTVPDITCWHCRTLEPQTGQQWDRCDFCHVMLSAER